jgi:hypothetical protein
MIGGGQRFLTRGDTGSFATPEAARGKLHFGCFELLLLGIVPAVFLRVGRFQFFPPPGWVDPGIYLGYFLNFPRAVAYFGPDYFSVRLPWTLAGFALHRIFTPILAHYILNLGFYYLAIGSVYVIVAPRCGRVAGVAAAWWLAFNPLWIAAVMQGYVDGPGMSYLFGALACLINRGGLIGRRVDLCLAGAFTFLAFFTQLALGLFALLAVGPYLLSEQPERTDLKSFIVWGTVGALSATVCLSLLGAALGAPFLFFAAYLPQVKDAINNFGSYYKRPLAEWLPTAYRLLPPFGLACIGVTYAWRHRARQPVMVIGASTGLFVAIAWLAGYDFARGSVTLQLSFFSSYLLLGQALVFGALAGELLRTDEVSSRRQQLVILMAMAALASLPILAVERIWAWEASWRSARAFWLVPGAVFALAIGAAIGPRPRAALPLLMLATTLAATANLDTRRIFRAAGNPDYKPFYEAAIRLNDIVEGAALYKGRMFFWYNRASFTTGDPRRDAWLISDHHYKDMDFRLNALDSLTALWLWNRTNLNFEMPALTASEARTLVEPSIPTSVVLLCQQPAECAAGIAALEKNGIATSLKIREQIAESGAINLTVMIVAAALATP